MKKYLWLTALALGIVIGAGSDKGAGAADEDESSSSEYVPFDHKDALAEVCEIGVDAYKQFIDDRNGRSYYYITITG